MTYAVGNVAAGLVGCCVVSGSVSRTAVNERNGGRTQLVSVMASVTMLVVLLVATPLIRFLPVPVLTAIVVNALIGATEFGIARRLWRVNRVELGIFTGAFFGVLLLGAIKGVLVGMVLSFIDVLMRAAAPQRTFLGTLPGKAGFFPIDRVSGVQALPHIVLYRFSGSLFFANIRRFQEDIEGAVQPDTQAVIVDGSAIVSVDITACDRLVVLNRKLRAQGVRFYLTEHIGEVNDQLRHFEAGELIESGAVRRTIQGALRDADAAVDIGGAQQRIPDNMDDIRQLQGRFDGRILPCLHDPARDLPCERFFAVIPQNACQLFAALGVHKVRCRFALLAHPHVQRCIRTIGKAAGRIVQLMAGNAQIQQRAVDLVDAKAFQSLSGIAEVASSRKAIWRECPAPPTVPSR